MSKCQCGYENSNKAVFCMSCGSIVDDSYFSDKEALQESEKKIKAFLQSLQQKMAKSIVESKIEQLQDLFNNVSKTKAFLEVFTVYNEQVNDKKDARINNFIQKCNNFLSRDDSFQIAVCGTIKAGKSTLINAMLKDEYASTSVTPETAVLTKFCYGQKDEIVVSFYNESEWQEFWQSASKGGVFREEYEKSGAEFYKSKWINHSPITEELSIDTLKKYTSSQSESHYFVKEVCVRLKDFPFGKNIVFVDTPGLDDPVDYRSKVTRDYIDRANAVIVCVQAKTLTAKEVDTIYRIFDNTRGKPEKVYVLGTQYDTLNNPLKEWEQQKQSWIKYLSSDRDKDIAQFTKIQAEKNIIQVSGYVGLLLDLYEKDKIDDDGRKKIKECSFKFFEDTDFEKHIEGLRKISNIHIIFERIKEDILQTAEQAAIEDARSAYKFLYDEIETYFQDSAALLQENFDVSQKDINAINERIAKAEEDLEGIKNQTRDLEKIMKKFEEESKENIIELKRQIDSIIEKLSDSVVNGNEILRYDNSCDVMI